MYIHHAPITTLLRTQTGLCRELFHKPHGGALRVANSRSRAASHLSPDMLGHIVGLGITDASEAAIKECLSSQGITTNKIHGEWTGVSLARFLRLVRLVGSVWRDEKNMCAGTSLVARFAWEKAKSKDDLLSFLLALHSHTPILRPGVVEGLSAQGPERHKWLAAAFSAVDLEDESALREAAAQLVCTNTSDEHFAHSFELLAAGMSSVHAFRSAVRLERHAYKGGKEVPDCVEVVVREILELVLFDTGARTFDTARLPPTTCPMVASFFAEHDSFASPREASESWYSLCQELPGAQYLQRAPGGERSDVVLLCIFFFLEGKGLTSSYNLLCIFCTRSKSRVSIRANAPCISANVFSYIYVCVCARGRIRTHTHVK